MATCFGGSNNTMADANRLVASLILPLAPGPRTEPRIHIQARVLRCKPAELPACLFAIMQTEPWECLPACAV